MIKKILFVAQDPGGFNSIVPVFRKLGSNKSYQVTAFLAGASKKIADRMGIPYINGEGATQGDVKRVLENVKPCVIVAGTSGSASLDKDVVKISTRMGIPTISILDFWINYNVRFSFKSLPDAILIMDKYAKAEMIKAGFPKDKLIVTGNPAFDMMKPIRSIQTDKSSTILFVDQPISSDIVAGWHQNYNYDELEVFKDLLEALERIGFSGDVVVKLHPRTHNKKKFNPIIKHFSIAVTVDTDDNNERVLAKSSLIFGMTSLLLFEAAMRGKKVLSYQPRLAGADPLVTNRLGLTKFVYRKSELAGAIQEALRQKRLSERDRAIVNRYTKQNATGKVIQYVDSLCSRKSL